jgi:hypothetical protein
MISRNICRPLAPHQVLQHSFRLDHARLVHIRAPYNLLLVVLLSPAIVITARLPATRTLAHPFRGGCAHVTDPVELPGAHRVDMVLARDKTA